MSEFKVALHPQQLEAYNHPSRFKIVVAGRRWGKSRLALYTLFIEALRSKNYDVYYIAPTFEQAKRIMFRAMKDVGKDLIEWAHENTATMRLINGREIHIAGSDRPDTLRGVAMAHCVIDEYASIKPMIWEEIVRPALIDSKGSCLFIGTPQGKNHFYDLYNYAQGRENWGTWQFNSKENPFLDPEEVKTAYESLSTQVARQELEASFESFDSGLFKEEWIKFNNDEPTEGDYYITVDLAGFESTTTGRGSSSAKLDETAIVATKVHQGGWYVADIEHGRWNTRETSVRILRLAQEKGARCIGIERGALMNAVMPYLEDQMRRIGFYPRIESVTHGGKNKTDRVVWALQGRFERGVVTLRRGSWNSPFLTQLMDFPNPKAHDDLPDALSFLDQISFTPYNNFEVEDEYEPFDLVSGY